MLRVAGSASPCGALVVASSSLLSCFRSWSLCPRLLLLCPLALFCSFLLCPSSGPCLVPVLSWACPGPVLVWWVGWSVGGLWFWLVGFVVPGLCSLGWPPAVVPRSFCFSLLLRVCVFLAACVRVRGRGAPLPPPLCVFVSVWLGVLGCVPAPLINFLYIKVTSQLASIDVWCVFLPQSVTKTRESHLQ